MVVNHANLQAATRDIALLVEVGYSDRILSL